MAFDTFGTSIYKGSGEDFNTESNWGSDPLGCLVSVTPPTATIQDVALPVCLNADSRAVQYVPGEMELSDLTWTFIFEEGQFASSLAELGTYGCWKIPLSNSNSWIGVNGYFKSTGIPELSGNGFVQINMSVKATECDEVVDT